MQALQLPDELNTRLGVLAKATGRTENALVMQAIQDFVDRESWQVEEVQKALKEADNGDFATDEEMAAFWNRWTKK